MLSFASFQEYKNILELILPMNPNEVNQWFLSNEFSNLDVKYNEMFEHIGTLETENDIISYVRKNDAYLSIETDLTGDKEVMMATDNYQNFFANDKFLFKIGDDIIDIRRNLPSKSTMRNCGTPTAYAVKNSNCFRGRRVKLESTVVVGNIPSDPANDVVLNEIKLRGQRRTSCIWFNYTNPLDFGTPLPTMTTSYGGGNIVGPGMYGSPSCSDCWYITYSRAATYPTNNTEVITQINARGSSQGVGSNWAQLDCNN